MSPRMPSHIDIEVRPRRPENPKNARRISLQLGLTSREPDSRVVVDDLDITNMVRGVSLRAAVGEVTTVILELLPREILIDGHADVSALFTVAKPVIGPIEEDES